MSPRTDPRLSWDAKTRRKLLRGKERFPKLGSTTVRYAIANRHDAHAQGKLRGARKAAGPFALTEKKTKKSVLLKTVTAPKIFDTLQLVPELENCHVDDKRRRFPKPLALEPRSSQLRGFFNTSRNSMPRLTLFNVPPISSSPYQPSLSIYIYIFILFYFTFSGESKIAFCPTRRRYTRARVARVLH